MPDFPDDLLQLQRNIDAARLAADTYAQAIADERRVQFPDDEQIVERQTWPAEQDAELNRLRAAYEAATRAKRAHPGFVVAEDFDLRKVARAVEAAS
jgi:hypothetical protein